MSTKGKPKFYVVWKGVKPGIYTNWDECKANVHGFLGAVYKSFDSLKQANEAYASGEQKFIAAKKEEQKSNFSKQHSLKPKGEFIAVDGAWNTATLKAEYRGVKMPENIEIFRKGPFEKGTNNIMEFLALVHALALCKKNNWHVNIYSDSKTALAWLRNKKAKTKLEKEVENAELFDLINRAEDWILKNDYSNKVLKWETELWGEIPADFGRK